MLTVYSVANLPIEQVLYMPAQIAYGTLDGANELVCLESAQRFRQIQVQQLHQRQLKVNADSFSRAVYEWTYCTAVLCII